MKVISHSFILITYLNEWIIWSLIDKFDYECNMVVINNNTQLLLKALKEINALCT